MCVFEVHLYQRMMIMMTMTKDDDDDVIQAVLRLLKLIARAYYSDPHVVVGVGGRERGRTKSTTLVHADTLAPATTTPSYTTFTHPHR